MARQRWLRWLFGLCLGLLVSQPVLAFRCGGGLVTVGDSQLSVLNKCGSPAWTDRWREETITLPDTAFEHRLLRINERWIYNPGPTQFLRILSFRDGRVVTIEQGGRGFTVLPGMQSCDFERFSLGTSLAEVSMRCGEADMQERRYEVVSIPVPGGRRETSQTIDEWTFNLGPARFMRILIFRNGELVEIRSGERGF